MKTIAFFGHRQIFDKLIVKQKLTNQLKSLIPQGFSRLLIGCHGDFDSIALSASLNCKKDFNDNIKINIVISSLSYLNKFKYDYSRVDYYNDIKCETIFYDIEEIHFKNRITFSNRKMVDDCDLIICYVDMKRNYSGAKNTINYAIKQNKKIINLFYD